MDTLIWSLSGFVAKFGKKILWDFLKTYAFLQMFSKNDTIFPEICDKNNVVENEC